MRCDEYVPEGGWPICRYIADPPGKVLLQKYVDQFSQGSQGQPPTTPFLYIEVPAPALQKRSETYLPTLFLKGLKDPQAEARMDAESKLMHLELVLSKRGIDLIILADFHHFVTPARQQPLDYEVTWIKALIKDIDPPIVFDSRNVATRAKNVSRKILPGPSTGRL